MTKPQPREHGTTRGYNQHRRNGELPCAECMVAFDQVKSRGQGKSSEKTRRTNRARSRAFQRLGDMFPVEFHVLLQEEKARIEDEEGPL